jgi:1-acyl-sn-glycerol-3-phosphate acyltransferase
MSFYNGARVVTSPLLRLIFCVKRTGMANQPSRGTVIVCSNHRSNYDPVILGASLRYDLRFMAKAELFKNPFLRFLITILGAFPINRGRGDTAAIDKASHILKSGGVLLMFPEGHRNKQGGTPLMFKSGAAMLAYRTHASVLPVAIVSKGDVRPLSETR